MTLRELSVGELKHYFGDPTPWMRVDGTISHEWENILTVVVLPDAVPYAGDLTHNVSTCRVHKKAAPFFAAAFKAIALAGAWPEIKDWGGTYQFRANRNNPAALSTHCWGLGIDLNPIEYPNGSLLRQDQRLIDAFAANGFAYGGDFHHTKDPMHWSFADVSRLA